MIPARKIRVLIVDDSASVRQALKDILGADPEIEVIATAGDPFAAAERMRKEVPDVITLDIEMPRMDGISFLEKLMRQHPIPVVICSSLTGAGSQTALAALERGAVEVIEKPRNGTPREWKESSIHICDAVRAAARARLTRSPARTRPAGLTPVGAPRTRPTTLGAPRTRPTTLGAPRARETMSGSPGSRRSRSTTSEPTRVRPAPLAGLAGPALQAQLQALAPKLTASAMIPLAQRAMLETTETVVAIGASTGGTEALLAVLRALPADAPGIVIVQHMPEKFTTQFAARLNTLCAITVKEAASGDTVLRGQALIAPGNHHLLLKRSGARYYVVVSDGPLVNRHRPSVDVLFRSTARYAGANAVGVILTGMGDDGARGLLEMKQAGAYTVAQDEASCVVFGMPAEAIKHGGVDRVLPLDRIASELVVRRR